MSAPLLLLSAYLLGSIPIGLIVCKAVGGIDVRQYGSGNTGASNVWRTLGQTRGPIWGPVWGSVVFVLDVSKGLLPVLLAHRLSGSQAWLPVAAGLAAIVGHNFSVFLGGKGGKGVATTLGVAFGLSWLAALIAFGVWLLVLGLTRYISLSSLIATPLGAFFLWKFNGWQWPDGLFALLATVFVIVKHRANIARIRAGTEPKIRPKKTTLPEAANV